MTAHKDKNAPNLAERFLKAIFNRRNIVGAAAIGLLVDQTGYAGEFGGNVLRSNDFTRAAAPYYEGVGTVMHFGWESTVELATGINDIVQHYDNL